jgi:hypothetical protein
MTSDENWLDRPADPLWRNPPVIIMSEAGITLPEDGAVYVREANGAWRQIGTADAEQFGTITSATLHTEPPEAEEVSWGATDGDRMSFTVTFTFDPAAAVARWYGPPPDPDDVAGGPVTYLEETPEGDIVERIDHVVQGWERTFPWGDAMRWTGEEEPEPETHEGSIVADVTDTLADAWTHWQDVGATDEERDYGLFQVMPSWWSEHRPYRGNLAASLDYIRRAYERGLAGGWTLPYYGNTPITESTRERARRALAEWASRGGSIAQWRPRWMRPDDEREGDS